jgi:DNA-binding NarL/FixJ family response regulator
MITVLLVDDDPVIRQLLHDILDRYPDIKILGEAENGEDAIALTLASKPAVVLMDFNLPTMNGIEATTLIKLQSPCTAVIGLTASTPGDAEYAMVAAGAAAVLNKGEMVGVLHPIIVQSVPSSPAPALASPLIGLTAD